MTVRIRRAVSATRLNRSLLAAAIVGTLAFVAGCGATASSSGSTPVDANGLARAVAAVRDGTQPNQGFQAPGPAFDAAQLRGKKIWVITFLSVPFAQQNVTGLEEAAAAIGATVTAVDGTAGVDAYQRGIRQAIAQGADAIIIGTLNPSLFTADLNAARARGIKVIAVSSHAPGQLPPAGEPVDGYVDPCYTCAGQLMADSVIADSKGKANALVLWSSDVQIPGQAQLSAIQDEFKKNCPSCTLKVEDVPSTQWATRLQSVTQVDITSNPNLTYVSPLYDGMVPFIQPAVRAANATNRVKISSFNATSAIMQQISGQGGVLSDVGIGSVRYGWAWADQTFRALSGSPTVKDGQLPVRLFDSSNIHQVNLNASTDTWYGNVDYRSEYRKLWGVTS